MSAVKTTFLYSLLAALLGMAMLLTCAGPIVRAFIDDPATVEYGGILYLLSYKAPSKMG